MGGYLSWSLPFFLGGGGGEDGQGKAEQGWAGQPRHEEENHSGNFTHSTKSSSHRHHPAPQTLGRGRKSHGRNSFQLTLCDYLHD